MSRLSGQVYDQTKSADLSETQADPTELCRRPGRRHGSPTKSGLVHVVEFGLKCAYDCAQLSANNTAQNSSDNLPSYLQTITLAQMLIVWR